jgi:hypothetical protein
MYAALHPQAERLLQGVQSMTSISLVATLTLCPGSPSYKILTSICTRGVLGTLSFQHSLLLGETGVDPTFWKWVLHKVVRPTWISSNEIVNVEKRVLLALLFVLISTLNQN